MRSSPRRPEKHVGEPGAANDVVAGSPEHAAVVGQSPHACPIAAGDVDAVAVAALPARGEGDVLSIG